MNSSFEELTNPISFGVEIQTLGHPGGFDDFGRWPQIGVLEEPVRNIVEMPQRGVAGEERRRERGVDRLDLSCGILSDILPRHIEDLRSSDRFTRSGFASINRAFGIAR
jgi:hypothetical protein